MLLIILYYILNTIIAKLLENKSKIVGLVHLICFIILSFYYILLINNKHIVGCLQWLLGENNYTFITNIISSGYMNDKISIMMMLQMIVLVMSFVVILVYAKKIIVEYKISKILNINILLIPIKTVYIYSTYILIKIKVYLKYCRLLN